LSFDGEEPIVSLDPGHSFRPEALVGADGLHSVVRAAIYGRAPPDYPGHIMYRTLIPSDAASAEMAADAVSLWLYPGGHVVHYAVSGGRRINIAAFAESPVNEESWNAPAAPAEVLGPFTDAAPPLRRILASAEDWQKWAAADRAPLARWGKGAVTLIGDAAHASLPYLAQGAVMALEDAVVLGQCVARAPSLPQAFRDYESARLARTARLQRLSRRQGRIYHLRDPMRLARNAVLGALPPNLLLRQLDWLYGWRPEGRSGLHPLGRHREEA
jgi:salicylate hydroxylase